MKTWERNFIVSGVLASLAVVAGISVLYYFTFPPDPIFFPVEIVKVTHNDNETATIMCRWIGENDEVERGFEPLEKGYGHHILVFRCPDEIKSPIEEVHDKAVPFVTYQYLFVHYGDTHEVNIPDRGWFVEMHDGDHIAIWVYADGSRELVRDEHGYKK